MDERQQAIQQRINEWLDQIKELNRQRNNIDDMIDELWQRIDDEGGVTFENLTTRSSYKR